ncbi:uncharacterized protein LOC142164086 [Nicotiana tabacum]|uniref:Uncharacterized protein LOC142164086 n=1 Tax=Nicotiana tabacum TaxID=4097 RepID=A0AC58RX86_TOBAC
MAGTVTLLSSTYACEWIIDSGASHHITPCKELLDKLRSLEKQQDMSKLTKELLCKVIFFPNFGVFQGLYNGKVMGIGRESSGLYILHREFKPTIGAAVAGGVDEAELWHLRLGHPSTVAMQHIPSLKNKVNNTVQENCSVCPIAKQISLPRGDKLAPSTRRTVLMGYYEVQKGYRLFDLDSKTFFVSRDVSFREGILLFRAMQVENEEDVLFMPINDITPPLDHPPTMHHGNNSATTVEETTEPHITDDHETNTTDNASASQHNMQPANSYNSVQGSEPTAEEPDTSLKGAESAPAKPNATKPIAENGRGKKVTKQPIWLKYYVTSKDKAPNCLYSITNYVEYDHLSIGYQEYLIMFSAPTEPKTFKKAFQDQRWIEAM